MFGLSRTGQLISMSEEPGKSVAEASRDSGVTLGTALIEGGIFRWWGKARPDPSGAHSTPFHPLPLHSLDVAAVGVEVLARTPGLLQLLSSRLRLRPDQTTSWVAFWLALHDLGKFAESFQSQCPEVFEAQRGRPPNPARPYTLRHDSLGMLFWKAVMREQVVDESWFGPHSEDLAYGLDFWAAACTGHHGQPPTEGDAWNQHFNPREDRAAALAFADAVRSYFIDDDLTSAIAANDPPGFIAASQELSWWVAGLAVLADWLGSNTDYFPYSAAAPSVAQYWPYARRQAVLALAASGITAQASRAALPFSNLFTGISQPSPLQAWASDVELHVGPQIHLLEDVTGAGKTEAALMLTHRLMAEGVADGFFVALPTMATANAMYGRIAETYARLFEESASLVLAHGQRVLVEDFAATVLPPSRVEHDPRQLDTTASVRCTAWLADHNKRALLSPAGVGTIDQALLAVLHSKHQSLRLLGLLRKVLVVDEVHACDAYMQGVLEALLRFHARAGGSAVLLSATLPQRMKQGLLDAFADGLMERVPAASEQAYPLATRWPVGDALELIQDALSTRADVKRRVRVRSTASLDEVHAGIAAALASGQCVCWVRNTVADALEAFEHFRRTQPSLTVDSLLLFHARFALHDRLAMEERVLHCFGKTSTPAERAGKLLIATQVVEQSLDVDFDLVVTDLAPIDRVIQRAGRLRRHRRTANGTPQTDPAVADARGEPWLWVLTPPWSEDPGANWFKSTFPKAASVYPHHGQLWLTARALAAGAMSMPDDARSLIEGVFGADAEVPSGLDAIAQAAQGLGFAAQTQAQMNSLNLEMGYRRHQGFDWWGEAQTPSRLGDASSTVTLARWEHGVLRPWVERSHGWAYSSLRVAERLAASTAEPTDPALRTALQSTLQQMPAGGRWTILLPLIHSPQGWIGETLGAARKGQVPPRLYWVYDGEQGLRQVTVNTNTEASEDPEP